MRHSGIRALGLIYPLEGLPWDLTNSLELVKILAIILEERYRLLTDSCKTRSGEIITDSLEKR